MNCQNGLYYYFDNNTLTTSKLLALEYESTYKKRSNFYYHDHVYSQLNWNKEPPHPLDFYYREQAQKIRDEYDYVILCYSGGIDSTNILETFYYNNIKLDKIITLGSFSQDSFIGDDSNKNGEYYFNVLPLIKKFELDSIFQVIDYTDIFYNLKTLSLVHDPNWIEKTGSWFSPHNWVWRDIHNFVVPTEFRNKKVAIIFGKDKPILKKDNKDYFFNFADTAINSYGFGSGIDGIDIINFYWDPSFPDILIKQLHIIKKYVETNRIDLTENKTRQNVLNFFKITAEPLIYNIQNPLSFVGKKSVSTIISARDSYLINKKNSDVYEFFKNGVLLLRNRLGSLDMPVRFSKNYYLID